MKTLNWWAVVVLLAFAAVPIRADEVEPPRILVEGEAEVLLEPDYIEWVVDIRTRNKVPKIARDANKALFEQLLDIADKARIDEQDILSGEPTYEQELDHDGQGKPKIDHHTGTEVYRRVTLVLRDMDELDEMLDAVHPLGVFYVVRRKSTKYDEVVKRVEAAALKDARVKAIEQAAALGQKIGRAFDVDVSLHRGGGGSLFGPPPEPIEKDYASAGPGGKIRVKAYAQVRFHLE